MQNQFEVSDNDSLLLDMAFTTAGSRKDFNLFPEVLFADVVHGTNREEHPLLLTCGKDAHGESFILLECFMPLEKQWMFMWCFTSAMLKLFDLDLLLRVQCVMTETQKKLQHLRRQCLPCLSMPR